MSEMTGTSINSNFVIQLNNQINRIVEIINSPPLVSPYLDSLHDIHQGILMMLDSYKTISINSVKKQIIESIDMNEFQTKLKADLKAKNKSVKIKKLTKDELKTFVLINRIPELMFETTDYFNELESYVDLGMDRNNLTASDKSLIKNYYLLKDQIIDFYKDIINSVKKFEQRVCDNILDINLNIKPLLEMIYNEHLDLCLKAEKDKSLPKISQRKFFRDRLKELL